MAVYVDNAKNRYGRMIMSHMWADSREELEAMLKKLQLSKRWIQEPPKASWLHYDICQKYRWRAVMYHGAIVTDKYGPVMHTAKLRGDIVMIERINALRARRVENNNMRASDDWQMEEWQG